MRYSRSAPIAHVRTVAWVVIAVTVGMSSLPRTARADEPAPDARARAEQLFDSALADVEAGRFAEACPKFLASQEADPKTTTLLNLGSCYERNGQTASAWAAFREAETLARRISRPELMRQAHEHAEALVPKLARLVINVGPARSAGLSVFRDGSPVPSGEWNVAIPVNPGVHEIAARAPGRVEWQTRVSVTTGSTTAVVPDLAPLTATPVATNTAAGASWWTGSRMAAATVTATGAAALVTGGVLALLANANYRSARDQCASVDQCPAVAVEQARRAYSLADVATVTMLGGAFVAALGGAFLYFSPSISDKAAALEARGRF